MAWPCDCSISSLLPGQRGWIRQPLSAVLSTECGKCCRHHCPQQGDALRGYSFLHSWLWSWPPWGAATTIWAVEGWSSGWPRSPTRVQLRGTWAAPMHSLGRQGLCGASRPWLAEGPCCSVALGRGTKMFHGSDRLFPSFQILQAKLQAEKYHVLMGAGSQRYASLGKAVRISR